MKKLSDTYKELGLAFTFPIKVKDFKGKLTYYEDSTGYWRKSEYDSNGNKTYYRDSTGYWYKSEYNSDGNMTHYENSNRHRMHEPQITNYDEVAYLKGVITELKKDTERLDFLLNHAYVIELNNPYNILSSREKIDSTMDWEKIDITMESQEP